MTPRTSGGPVRSNAKTLTLPSPGVPGEGKSRYHSPRHGNAPMIRTKIVATLGPACGDVETLYRLFESGVDVCRLNFSHGTLNDHLLMLRNIREAAARYRQPIAVLGDLGGPRIRLGQVTDESEGGLPIKVGDELIVQRQPIVGHDHRVSSTYKNLVDDVKVGD